MLDLALPYFGTVLGIFLGIVLIGRILRQNNRPSVSIAWLFAIVFMPYVAVPAYILIGGRKMWLVGNPTPPIRTLASSRIDLHPSLLASVVDNVLSTAGMAPARAKLRIEFLSDGEATYKRLLEMIRGAQRTIHVMTYILGRDKVGRAIVEALTQKAREGVQVRLLLDAWGSLRTSGGFVQELRDAGGQVATFMPLLPTKFRWSLNWRNHRKVVVVDGCVALMGGMNLGEEYMGLESTPDRWIDTNAIVHGAAALDLEDVFLNDWRFATGETIAAREEDIAAGQAAVGGAVGQIVASGPNIVGDPMYEAILSATYEVTQRLWIMTPYFVPDDGLVRAMCMQARLGRDVRILIPTRSNHFSADLARGRFLRELIAAGVRVYKYSGRMIHAKHIVFDDRIAVMGSINFDMRSLYLNFEVALFLYTNDDVQALAKWIESHMVDATEFRDTRVGPIRAFIEDLAILVAPLL